MSIARLSWTTIVRKYELITDCNVSFLSGVTKLPSQLQKMEC